MPTFRLFDLECLHCGKRFEAMLEAAEPFPRCPACEGADVQRCMGFAGYQMHGNNGASVRPLGSGCFKGRKK